MEFETAAIFRCRCRGGELLRAAEKNERVATESLSKAIQSIEDEYGVTLVKNNSLFQIDGCGESLSSNRVKAH